MPINSGIASNLGSYVKLKSYGLTFNDLQTTSGAGAKTFTLDTLGQGSVILYMRVKHSVAFAGTNLVSMTVSVGKSGGAVDFFVPAFDVFQAVADGTLAEATDCTMGQLSAVTLTATFTPGGANCSACTAGQVNIDVAMMPVTTPTAVGLYGSTQVL